jgi:hypothetical protein
MMTSSIRTKLFWGISSLIIFFVLLSWFLNFNLLDKYYTTKKGMILQNEFRYIDRIYNGNIAKVQLRFEKIVHNTGVNIVILDRNFEVKYSFFPRPMGVPSQSMPKKPRFPQLFPKLTIGQNQHIISMLQEAITVTSNF